MGGRLNIARARWANSVPRENGMLLHLTRVYFKTRIVFRSYYIIIQLAPHVQNSRGEFLLLLFYLPAQTKHFILRLEVHSTI